MVRLAAHRPDHAGTPRAAIVSAVRPVSLSPTAPHQSHLAALWLRGPSQWRIAAPELLLFTGPANGKLLLFEDSCEINSHSNPSLDVVVCQVGNRVGVKRCSDDTMHIFIDGEDMGPAATAVPKVHTHTHSNYFKQRICIAIHYHGCLQNVYAVLDLYGRITAVSIVSSSLMEDTESVKAPSLSSDSCSEGEEDSTPVKEVQLQRAESCQP